MKRLAVTLVCAATLCGAQAQDSKVSKEREALRRAQTALRAAQEQQATLQADMAKTNAGADAARREAAQANVRIAALAQHLKAREAELSAVREQLRVMKTIQLDAEAKAAEHEQLLQQQLASARQDGAARLQANQALTALLERSTQALKEAEIRNAKLRTFSEALLRRYTSRSVVETSLLGDPFLGLTAVQLEDTAEQLRKELDGLKVEN
jgi:chromosome segregation ATPase